MFHVRRCPLWGAMLSLLLAGCSLGVPTVTLKGRVLPPSISSGLPLAGTPLAVYTLSGSYGKASAATVQDAQGHFQFDLETDRIESGGELVKLAWLHPSRGGILLERTYRLAKDMRGEIQGDLTDLATLVTLAIEAQRQLDPTLLPSTPDSLETSLQSLTASSRSLLTLFQQRYNAYLAGAASPPGADADLAQSAGEMLFK